MLKRYITPRARCLFVWAFICEFDMFVVEVILVGCAASAVGLYRCLRPDHLDLDEDVHARVLTQRRVEASTVHQQMETQTTRAFPSRELRNSHRMAERRKKMSDIVASRKAENAALRQRRDTVQQVRRLYWSMDSTICLTSTSVGKRSTRVESIAKTPDLSSSSVAGCPRACVNLFVSYIYLSSLITKIQVTS